jgi:WYL domain
MNNRIKSYLILLDNLHSNSKKYSRADFMQKLKSEGLSYSDSAITRILNKINVDYGISIVHKKEHYEIDKDQSDENYLDNYRNLKSLLFRQVFQKNSQENVLIAPFVSFDNATINKGIERIEPVLNAILEKRKIKLEYQTFYESEAETHIIKPLFVKEYQKRWYLIAQNKEADFETFAFDRIQNLDVLSTTFSSNLSNIDLFKNTIGVHYSDKVEIIILEFEALQGNYIKTLPLHSNQKIIAETDNFLTILIEVNINFELIQILKSYGSTVKIIEPEHLKAQIIQDLNTTLKLYKK